MPDNRQILDNTEAYSSDEQIITQSLNYKLGITERTLPGAQQITVATVQSNLLTTDIPNYSPNRIAKGRNDDLDYQDNSDEQLHQVDGTMDTHTLSDNSDDNKDNEPDNNTCKTPRKIYAPADATKKDMTKKRQADVLKKQQDRENAKAQATVNKDKNDNEDRVT